MYLHIFLGLGILSLAWMIHEVDWAAKPEDEVNLLEEPKLLPPPTKQTSKPPELCHMKKKVCHLQHNGSNPTTWHEGDLEKWWLSGAPYPNAAESIKKDDESPLFAKNSTWFKITPEKWVQTPMDTKEYCLGTCCVQKVYEGDVKRFGWPARKKDNDFIALYPNGNEGGTVEKQPTILSFLNPGTQRNVADVFTDLNGLLFPGKELAYGGNNWLTPETIPCLQPGTVIMVLKAKTIMTAFWEQTVPLIKVPFVLYTVDGDDDSPTPALRKYLDHPLLIHWYNQNCDIFDWNPKELTKMTCVSIGTGQWPNPDTRFLGSLKTMWGMDQTINPVNMHPPERPPEIASLIRQNRTNKLLFNFGDGNLPADATLESILAKPDNRQKERHLIAWLYREKFKPGGYADTVPYQEFPNWIDFGRRQSQFRFILSPRGMGWDCFRNHESLYVGVIPIMLRNSGERAYEHSPVLIVDKWEEVTEELLDLAWDVWGPLMDHGNGKKRLTKIPEARKKHFPEGTETMDMRASFIGYYQHDVMIKVHEFLKGTEWDYMSVEYDVWSGPWWSRRDGWRFRYRRT